MSEELPEEDLGPIKLPQAAYEPLRQILSLDESSFSALARALLAAKPQATQERFLDQIDESVPKVDRPTLRSIIRELTELDGVCAQLEMSAEDVSALISTAAEEDTTGAFSGFSGKFSILKDRLATLLGSPHALSLTAKASDLLTEHQHFFYNARLFSDMRPVFTSDAKGIEAAVIMHNLVIHYGDSDNHNDFHVALDDSDIKMLKELLERAEEKSATLRKMMKRAGVNFLETAD